MTRYLGPSLSSQLAFPTSSNISALPAPADQTPELSPPPHSTSSSAVSPKMEGTTHSLKYEEGEGHMPPPALADGGLPPAIQSELPPHGHDTLEWQ
jgi:hypothetical protein